ncbi:hypothetical protein [Tepidiforma sp.]|uniref:hypothetical protein n=1 Tax=Tepidiforma sp. TaxID=2682230 RepID=UPI002634902F|nr:hypothetical protein [Tepidiforma sp.]MCX7619026.1 hypothetical protein [Tepidiforma sp.]
MRLRYLGPDPAIDAALPLPEGWPAADHDEPDPAAAAAKLASGLYAEHAARGGRRRAEPDHEQEVTDAGDSTTA